MLFLLALIELRLDKLLDVADCKLKTLIHPAVVRLDLVILHLSV